MQYNFSETTTKMKASKIRELMKYASMPGVISLAGGNPDPINFPFDDVKTIINNWDKNKSAVAMQYGSTGGFGPLQEMIISRMQKRSLHRDGQSVLLTTGGQQGLFLISRIFINPGDVVLVEDPSFIGAIAAFLSHGAEIIGIPLRSDGVDSEYMEKKIIDLQKTGKNIKFFYTIPNFQNPTGVTMSQEKRKAIYDLSLKYNLPVLEDDPYGELFFKGSIEDYKPIKSHGNKAPIIYIGSFSKILCPGFRLGWIFADDIIVDKAGLAKQSVDACSSTFGQIIAHDYLSNDAIDRYLVKMREVYSHKRNIMLKEIDANFPSTVKTTRPEGGFFIFVDLPEGMSGDKLFKIAIEKKVAFVTGEPFYTDPIEGDKHLRLAYSNSTDEQIKTAIELIGNSMKNYR